MYWRSDRWEGDGKRHHGKLRIKIFGEKKKKTLKCGEMNSPTIPKTIKNSTVSESNNRDHIFNNYVETKESEINTCIYICTHMEQDKKKRADYVNEMHTKYMGERYPRIDYEFHLDLRKKIICKAHNSLNRSISSETFHIHTQIHT